MGSKDGGGVDLVGSWPLAICICFVAQSLKPRLLLGGEGVSSSSLSLSPTDASSLSDESYAESELSNEESDSGSSSIGLEEPQLRNAV